MTTQFFRMATKTTNEIFGDSLFVHYKELKPRSDGNEIEIIASASGVGINTEMFAGYYDSLDFLIPIFKRAEYWAARLKIEDLSIDDLHNHPLDDEPVSVTEIRSLIETEDGRGYWRNFVKVLQTRKE